MWIWLISALVVLIIIIALLGYQRVNVQRQVSPEGIEDDEAVRAYDRISRWPQFRLLRKLIIGELKSHHPEGTLVDAGCGPGYLISDIARALPHLSIIGMDISEEMIQKATRNISILGLEGRVSFRPGDIHELPFEDSSLDFVMSTLSLHHWSEPQKAIQEINRVLKAGGQFLIFDMRRDSWRIFYWLIRFAQKFILPSAMKRINEPTTSILANYTPVELDAIISSTSVKQWRIKPGIFWVFIWGHKSDQM